MVNSTHLFSTLISVTDSKKTKTMKQQNEELSREEQIHFSKTRKVLDTIRYSPRPDTLKAISDYAKKTQR
jgi:hypothetical protein